MPRPGTSTLDRHGRSLQVLEGGGRRVGGACRFVPSLGRTSDSPTNPTDRPVEPAWEHGNRGTGRPTAERARRSTTWYGAASSLRHAKAWIPGMSQIAGSATRGFPPARPGASRCCCEPGQLDESIALESEEPAIVPMPLPIEARLEEEGCVHLGSHQHGPRRGEPTLELLRPGAEEDGGLGHQRAFGGQTKLPLR